MGEHRDGGTLTLLYPQPGTTGLQVLTDDERDALHAVYGENAFLSRLRSHPNVAEKFYPEFVGAQD
ncbi:hypothetical protein [Brevibacterium siliguriense]|uniref:hypothetical protein n=1 Tax=Brevibacterium siliguriense TaxID=1136497 RepID=UPI002F90BFB3